MADPLISQGIELAWHSIKRTASVVATILAVAGLGWAVYAGLIRPTTKPNATEKYQAEKQEFRTTEIAPKQTFGCMNFKLMSDGKFKTDKPLPEANK